jgi:hypothetical protein
MTVVVSGFRETARAFGKVNRQFPKDLRKQLLGAAEPVRADAATLAGAQIRNMGIGKPWSGMRVGGGVTIVYVAPKLKGRKSKFDSRRRRPNLADLLMERAMKPALERNREEVARRAEKALDEMQRDWGLGG